MKNLIIVIALFAVIAAPANAAPLIYKSVIKVDDDLGAATPVINTARYRQIRIYVAPKSGYSSPFSDRFLSISAVEDREFFLFGVYNPMQMRDSILIDTPPSAIKLHIDKKGEFSIYVWGS